MQLIAQRKSVAEYLTLDDCSEIRHEYVDGDVYAMSGASIAHQVLIGNLYWHARRSAGGYCQLFIPGAMLRISRQNSYYYPDFMAACDPAGVGDRYVTAPCFIAEILSPSTARIDRGEKWRAYRALQTLDEYVLIDQDRMQVAVYRGGGPWASRVLHEPGDVLEVACIGMRLALVDLYDGVKLPPLQVRDDIEVPQYVMIA